MRNKFTKKNLIIFGIIALVVCLAITAVVISEINSVKVSKKITLSEAQQIVDDTFNDLPAYSADGAKFIFDNLSIKVNSLEYGNEKDIILSCVYTSVNSKDAIIPYIEDLAIKLKGATTTKEKDSIAETFYKEYISKAEPVSGKITLYIYETTKGLQLYLSDEAVNTCTGGIVEIYDAISNLTEIHLNGYDQPVEDVTNDSSLRRAVKKEIELKNYSSDKPFAGTPLQTAINELKSDFHKNFIEAKRYSLILKGVGNTLSITALSAFLGIIIGFVIAIIRCTNQMTGKLKLINAICKLYVTVVRGIPVMVQLLIISYVILTSADIFTAAVICFGINSGAYVAEIVRGGIMSVDKGQIEAGRSLGFNYVQTMVHFVVPQAFKAILPALANEFITLLKESSVAFYIGVMDLTAAGNSIRSVTYNAFMPLIAVAAIYLVLVLILSKFVGLLERRLAKSDH